MVFDVPGWLISLFGLWGLIFAVGGTYVYWRYAKFPAEFQEVSLVVIANHRGPDAEGPTYCPEFEITDGEFQGKRWIGHVWSDPPIHNVGDRSLGYFDPKTGRIESTQYNRAYRLMAAGLSVGGLALIGFAAYLASQPEIQ